MPDPAFSRKMLLAYYVATALFLGLDIFADLNVRIAFLEGAGSLRAAYYGICFACLGLMLWRPQWTAVISAFESLVTLVALIVSFGVRAIVVSDAMLEGHASYITMQEVVNFVLSGSVAYLAWTRGMKDFQNSLR